jgi:hypothetical protein
MLILNIGLPSTGTTYLQTKIFRRAPDLRFVHRSMGPKEDKLCAVLRKYVAASGLTAGLMRQAITSRAFSKLDALAEGDLPSHVLLSDETLSVAAGPMWRGDGPDPERVAERLHALVAPMPGHLGPVKVLIGLQRQEAWLASRYAAAARHDRGFAQADFDARLRRLLEAPRLTGPLGWLDHARVFKAFAEHFGAEGVVFFWQESLGEHPGRVLKRVGHDLGGLDLAKPFRRLKRREAPMPVFDETSWVLPGEGGPLELREDLATAIAGRFAASNAQLAALRDVVSGRVRTNPAEAEAV